MAACTFRGCSLLLAIALAAAPSARAPMVITVEDYAAAPITGMTSGIGNIASLSRVNVLREEPGGAGRFFVSDLNGPLYILDKTTKAFTTYLDFNGRDAKPGLFDKLHTSAGFANGLISFQFAPDYRQSGKLYTIHLEEPGAPGSLVPDATSVPGLTLTGYAPTDADQDAGPRRSACGGRRVDRHERRERDVRGHGARDPPRRDTTRAFIRWAT